MADQRLSCRETTGLQVYRLGRRTWLRACEPEWERRQVGGLQGGGRLPHVAAARPGGRLCQSATGCHIATLPPHSINVFRTVVANTGIAMSAHQAMLLDT